MCEKGICNLCPICRRDKWKHIKKTKVFPFTKINKTRIESINNNLEIQEKNIYIYDCLNNLKLCYSLSFKLLSILFISYFIGLFTLFMFYPNLNFPENNYVFWLPFIISIGWWIIIWSPCCCGECLYNTYFNK